MTTPNKSYGRKTLHPTMKPRSLMDEQPNLTGVWQARIITLFPETFPNVLGASLTGKALQTGKWQLHTHDLRDYGKGKHRNVDDTPAGGGAGMVLRADVINAALLDTQSNAHGNWPILYMSPRGQRFDQKMAHDLSRCNGVTILCGRFEGVDERVLEHWNIKEVSLGDFVLTGGEIAAQAVVDASVRLLPDVLGNSESIIEESHSNGLLEHPQYTKPSIWEGRDIPSILLSGNHGEIAIWRQKMSKLITKERRPDLWKIRNTKSTRTDN
jgi:tRNA (guanine37-N1)-methyltransferase